jgi:hypothetical protein
MIKSAISGLLHRGRPPAVESRFKINLQGKTKIDVRLPMNPEDAAEVLDVAIRAIAEIVNGGAGRPTSARAWDARQHQHDDDHPTGYGGSRSGSEPAWRCSVRSATDRPRYVQFRWKVISASAVRLSPWVRLSA